MATINLGSIKFKWQGAYAGGTSYTLDDVVSYNGSSYICILASTGNLPTNTTYWEQMSAKGTDGTNGTNGTDLTSTLTTQGDIVYRDSSGLARLAAGTSGQVLQTNGTGANPSWGTVSSDFVKIYSNSITSDTYTINVDNIFSSTYNSYKVILTTVNNSGFGDQPGFRFINNSGSVISSSDYQYAGQQSYQASSVSGTGSAGSWLRDKVISQETVTNDNSRIAVNEIYIYGASNSSTRTGFQMFSFCYDGSNHRAIQQGGQLDNIGVHRGIQFTNQNGNPVFGAGSTIAIYGLK